MRLFSAALFCSILLLSDAQQPKRQRRPFFGRRPPQPSPSNLKPFDSAERPSLFDSELKDLQRPVRQPQDSAPPPPSFGSQNVDGPMLLAEGNMEGFTISEDTPVGSLVS